MNLYDTCDYLKVHTNTTTIIFINQIDNKITLFFKQSPNLLIYTKTTPLPRAALATPAQHPPRTTSVA